jgi:hypothetical protein
MRDFPANIGRIVCMIGKYEHHDATGLDSPRYGRRPTFVRVNVSRRDPTTDAGRLESITDGLGYQFVLARMANEYVVWHRRPQVPCSVKW